MQEQIHPADGTGQVIDLLAINTHVAIFLSMLPNPGNGGNQHAGTAAGGIIDALLALRPEHFRHQMHHGTVRVKLLCRVAAVIRKLFDEVLVTLAELVLRAVGNGQRKPGKMLDQVFQKAVRQTALVCPRAVSEDTGELFTIGLFNGPEGIDDGLADILRHHAHIAPMLAFRNDERMLIGKQIRICAILCFKRCGLLIIHIAQPFEEEQREDILFIAAGINVGPK